MSSSESSSESSSQQPIPNASLRPILPHPGSESGAPSPQTEIPIHIQVPKRRAVNVACEPCRKRKTKCTGQRPTCQACEHSQTECVYADRLTQTQSLELKRKYDDLERKVTPYEEIFHLIRAMPEKQAMDVFHRIRAGNSIPALVKQLKDGDLLLQMSLVPETHHRFEFPYFLPMPASTLVPSNTYVQSLVFQATLGTTESATPTSSAKSFDQPTPYTRPYHIAEIHDPLIDDMIISRWTSVTSDDPILRKLLKAFFLHHHCLYPFFQKDLFLQDLNAGRTDFCSELLVNAVLASACQSVGTLPDRFKFWEPHTLLYAFTAEAKRLWEVEVGKDRLTTVQAALLLNSTMNMNGLDTLGSAYLTQAITMAYNLNLFNPHELPETQKNRRKEWKNARLFTAWGLYNWTGLACYYYFLQPLVPVPPSIPLPDPTVHAGWYGEILVRYPGSPTPYPVHFGHTMHAICGLRSILIEIARSFPSEPTGTIERSLEQVKDFKAQLEAWFGRLSEPLKSLNIVFPHEVIVHLEYYTTLIHLCQVDKITNLKSHPPSEAEALTKETSRSEICLETLVRLYYLRHSFQSYNSFFIFFLTFLGDVALKRLSGDDEQSAEARKAVRSTLLLCAIGLNTQGQHFHLANLVYMALREQMQPQDADLLRTYTNPQSTMDSQSLMTKYIRSEFPFPIATANSDPRKATLDRILQTNEGTPTPSSDTDN